MDRIATSLRRAAGRTLLATAVPLVAACGALSGGPPAEAPAPSEGVNVGYGTRSPDELTGSVASVTQDRGEGLGYSRIEEVLLGRVPGLDVTRLSGGRYSIRIRGARSLMASNDPLIVVDGTALSDGVTGLAMINPSDVARVDVLKDAASTSVYGSRGANGVILITLKRAR